MDSNICASVVVACDRRFVDLNLLLILIAQLITAGMN